MKFDSLVSVFAPGFEYATGTIPGAGGVFRGPEGFKRFMEEFWNELADAHIEIDDLIDTGERVVHSLTM